MGRMGQAGSIRSIGICLKPSSSAAADVARRLAKWLGERRVEVRADPEAAALLDRPGLERQALAAAVDLLVVLGGDGTLLAVARAVGTRRVPILGVNLGTLGFLAEVAPDELSSVMERVLAGDYEIVERMRLDVRAFRGDEQRVQALALNDAVITRSDLSRMIDLETRADGVLVTTYHGDGLIVATPTGSTAYTLSAGGPILMPGARGFVLTPICPHTLTQRPLVLPENGRLEIGVHPRDGGAHLTIDGQAGATLERDDVVVVRCSESPAHFVVSRDRSRYDVLRTKLGWGRG